MESSLPKNKKLPLFFLFGVGLPSLALGFLSFRGIQNELSLLEQRQTDQHRAVAEFISDTLSARIDGAERTFARTVAGSIDPASPSLIRRLDSVRGALPLIEAAFLLKESGEIQLSTADILFRGGSGIQISRPPSFIGPAAEYMRAGHRAEFQENRYAEALTEYRRAFDVVSDSTLKGQALLAVSRVQRKAGRWEEALRAYETLIQDFGTVRTSEGMPLSALGFLERGALLLSEGDSLAALENQVELHQHVSEGQWIIERPQFDFLSGRVASSTRELSTRLGGRIADSLSEAFESSRLEEIHLRERTRRLLLFQGSAGEDLLARISGDASDPSAYPLRLSLEAGGQAFLVSLSDRVETAPGHWGLLLDAEHIRDAFLLPTLRSRVDSAATDWIVRKSDGSIVLAGTEAPAGRLALNATITGNFPPWLIEFHRRPKSPYSVLLASGQSVYLYMFLAIAVILAFGMVLTVRAVTQELELARMKSDFVSTVSHEFKSPLTSIRQLSEMLQTGRVPSEERRQRYYDVLVEQSSRLSSLVMNVLDLARIEEGGKEFRFELVEMGPLVEDVVEATRHTAGHQGFQVEAHLTGPLPSVRGDPEALRQAISNLLTNAIQYSGDSRKVDVSVMADRGLVTVAVGDEGVGIAEEEIGEVFDRFYRGSDEVARSVRGSGLGLTLVKEIAEAHGGVVEVASEVGKGSTFSIRLPTDTESGHA